jgi:hypothetical protein
MNLADSADGQVVVLLVVRITLIQNKFIFFIKLLIHRLVMVIDVD